MKKEGNASEGHCPPCCSACAGVHEAESLSFLMSEKAITFTKDNGFVPLVGGQANLTLAIVSAWAGGRAGGLVRSGLWGSPGLAESEECARPGFICSACAMYLLSFLRDSYAIHQHPPTPLTHPHPRPHPWRRAW